MAIGWWLRELSAAVPERVRERAATVWPSAILEMSRTSMRLSNGNECVLDERLSPLLERNEAVIRALSRFRHQRGTTWTLVLKLHQSLVLCRELTLPRAAETSLRSIIKHQVPELVPLSPDDVVIYQSIVNRDLAAGTIRVRVTMAKKTSVERIRQLGEQLNLPFDRVVAGINAVDTARLGPTLWMADDLSLACRRRKRIRRFLEAAAIVLLITAYGLHVGRTRTVRSEFGRVIYATRKCATRSNELAAVVRRQEDSLTYLLRRQQAPSILGILDGLTRILPTDTWLSAFVFQDGFVNISGTSRKPDVLIDRIETSSLFFGPKFTAATTLDPAGGGQHFELSFSTTAQERTR